MLYDEQDLNNSYDKIEAVDYHQEVEIQGGIKFTSYNAGHVLGAAMFLIEIAGVKVLYIKRSYIQEIILERRIDI